jgi:serine protease Do
LKKSLALLIAGCVLGVLIYLNVQRMMGGRGLPLAGEQGDVLPPPSNAPIPSGLKESPTRIAAAKLERVVVNIDTLGRPIGIPDWFGMATRYVQPQGAGSGVIIRSDGFIVTNDHVVRDAQTIDVTLFDGRKVRGELWGRDPQSDLAIVKIPRNNLPVARLGDSDQIAVGDPVIAVGNALGLGTTVTTGIISARERSVQGPDGNRALEKAIQTDAAINRGNSGGALALLNGDVIGINTAIFSTNEGGGNIGIGFAIPSNTVRKIANALIKNRKVERPAPAWVGIWYMGMSAEVAQAVEQELGFRYPQPDTGILVRRVEPGSPAEVAGIRPWDQVLDVDGKPIKQQSDFADAIHERKPGDSVKLKIYRPATGSTLTVTVRLAAAPRNLPAAGVPEEVPSQPRGGLRLPF